MFSFLLYRLPQSMWWLACGVFNVVRAVTTLQVLLIPIGVIIIGMIAASASNKQASESMHYTYAPKDYEDPRNPAYDPGRVYLESQGMATQTPIDLNTYTSPFSR